MKIFIIALLLSPLFAFAHTNCLATPSSIPLGVPTLVHISAPTSSFDITLSSATTFYYNHCTVYVSTFSNTAPL